MTRKQVLTREQHHVREGTPSPGKGLAQEEGWRASGRTHLEDLINEIANLSCVGKWRVVDRS